MLDEIADIFGFGGNKTTKRHSGGLTTAQWLKMIEQITELGKELTELRTENKHLKHENEILKSQKDVVHE